VMTAAVSGFLDSAAQTRGLSRELS
jgi:hypothetical protein